MSVHARATTLGSARGRSAASARLHGWGLYVRSLQAHSCCVPAESAQVAQVGRSTILTSAHCAVLSCEYDISFANTFAGRLTCLAGLRYHDDVGDPHSIRMKILEVNSTG